MKFSDQTKTRKKYERIRCPYCNSMSHVVSEGLFSTQVRVCKKGHQFAYSYLTQAIEQLAFNYKIKI